MVDALRLFFSADEDGEGWLDAEVRAKHFAGLGTAWFGRDELIRFARRLAETYPLKEATPLTLEGGFLGRGEVPAQFHVRLTFYPVGSVGLIGCGVYLATPMSRDDRPASQAFVSVELLTHYERMRVFARAFEALALGEATEAVLESEA